VRHHHDASAVARQDAVRTVALADVRQVVKGERHSAAPGVGDPRASEAREEPGQEAVQDLGDVARVTALDPSSEQHTPAIPGRAEVVGKSLGVAVGP
jgi:hypothetical protein